MCGIAAWGGKDPKKLDLHKLGTLGIFNEKRGVHSCGLTVDFKIEVGVDDYKVFRDFMTTAAFRAPKKYPFAIAHTRKATGGAHNKYNAHPFGYGGDIVEKGRFSFVGVHNGSLLNEYALANTYEVDSKGVTDTGVERSKIDSEILLECIYKSKNYKVLSEYNGAAALVFANINEPNVIYCFRGASKSRKHDLEEERPLFYWRENMNSLYISSMKNSLEAIAVTKAAKKNIHAFDCNTVYKITNGDINKAEKFKISRANASKEYISTYSDNAYSRNMGKDQTYYDAFGCGDEGDDCDVNVGACQDTSVPVIQLNLPLNKKEGKDGINPAVRHNIYKDRALKGSQPLLIEHYRTRYKRTGHNIEGIFCWIDDFGFYPLGATEKEASKALYDLCGKEFNNRNFNHVPMRYKIKQRNYIPFTAEKIINPEDFFFYFYDGIRLETKLDYEMVTKNPLNRTYTTAQLSVCACHPIIEESIKNKPFLSQNAWYKGKLADGVFNYLGCNKIYTFESGNCINIRPVEKFKVLTLNTDKENSTDKQGQEVFKKVNSDLLKNELNKGEQEASKAKKEEEAIDKIVKTVVFDGLFEIYHLLESTTTRLAAHPKNDLAIKCTKAIEKFVGSVDDIMENDLQVEINGKD